MIKLNEEVRVCDSSPLNEQRTTTPSKKVIPTPNPKTTPKQK